MSRALFIGLMSGTSLDGADAALAELDAGAPRILAAAHQPFEPALRAELLALNSPGADELDRAARAGVALARVYAEAVRRVLESAGRKPHEVRAIGCHGQTVRHRPERGYTVQLGNPALLAELSGVAVVADFRSRDVAAGGQGAPLAPAFHAALFAAAAEDRVVVNLGGIANLTWLRRAAPPTGFDCGPGNCLLDLWAARHLGTPCDADGAWAAGAQADAGLLERLLAEPFFAAAPPKSTGRDLFRAEWLEAHGVAALPPQVVQATLLELTARCVADACARHCAGAARLILCGGGTRNGALVRRLAALVAPLPVESSARHGIDPQLVEAAAFAWLAREALEGRPAGLPSVTGARGPRVLGALYPR